MRQRWQRATEPSARADDWLMTYADMITLLLCFFVIFAVASAARQEGRQPAPVAPSRQKTEVVEEIPPSVQPLKEAPSTARREPSPHAAAPAQDAAAKVPAAITPPWHTETAPADAPSASAAKSGAAAAAAPVDAPVPLTETLDTLKAQGTPDIVRKGDRLTTLELSSAAFFDSGSASLSDAGKSILQKVAVDLQSDAAKGYRITVEGHTDDTPIDTPQFPSNWELSTARASAVVHFLLDQGIPPQRLRAAGYADTFPEAPNRDAFGNPIPGNQALNRRVVLRLEKIDKLQP